MRSRVVAGVGVGALLLVGCTDTPADPGPAVVEFTAPLGASYDGEVRVAVHPLLVEGSTMELRLTLTPLGGDDERDAGRISLRELVDGPPVLSDARTLTTYDVLGGWSDARTTDLWRTETVVDQPAVYQAWFAAPDEDVEVLDLVVHPAWGSVTRVPVVRR